MFIHICIVIIMLLLYFYWWFRFYIHLTKFVELPISKSLIILKIEKHALFYYTSFRYYCDHLESHDPNPQLKQLTPLPNNYEPKDHNMKVHIDSIISKNIQKDQLNATCTKVLQSAYIWIILLSKSWELCQKMLIYENCFTLNVLLIELSWTIEFLNTWTWVFVKL